MSAREALKSSVVNAPADPIRPSQNLCAKCGIQELRPVDTSPFLRVLSLTAFECRRCAYRQTRLRFSTFTVLTPVLLILLGLAAAYLVKYGPQIYTPWMRTDDSQLNTADALSRARTSAGALSTFELMMLKKPRGTLDNATILQLWRAGVGVNVVMRMIRTSNADYDVSPAAIIELKEAGVDQNIILAMIDATYNVR